MDITEVCFECKNFFLKNGRGSVHPGKYTISGGIITPLDFLKPGQYFYLKGSDIGNDAVYLYTGNPIEELQDEVIESGAIWAMSVRKDFLALCRDIAEWRGKYENIGSANMSPFTSEDISGTYGYTKNSGGSGKDGTWQGQFEKRLRDFRRLSIF